MKKNEIFKNRRHILSDLIQENKLQIIAEIGVWKSGLLKYLLHYRSDIITEYWAIDLWKKNDGSGSYRKITNELIWDSLHLSACKLMIFYPHLRVIKSASLDAAKLFSLPYFDLVYIDADHHYGATLADIRAWLPLVRKGGFLTGHDYGGKKGGVTRAVDECFKKKEISIIDGNWIKKII